MRERCRIAQEAPGPFSVASEIAAVIGREAFGYLDMPIEMVCAPFVPVPFSPVLADFVLPKEGQILAAVKRVLKREA